MTEEECTDNLVHSVMLTMLNESSTTLQTQQRDRNAQWKNVQFLKGGPHKYLHYKQTVHCSTMQKQAHL